MAAAAAPANAAPDTAHLTTSQQVFTTYTLPQIRAIHKSLHIQIDEKAARLRTQVGNSYRELLGTADTIVQMRRDMGLVQNRLGRMGASCGRSVVGGKVAALGRFRGGTEMNKDFESEEDHVGEGKTVAVADLGQAARLRLLDACGLAVGRLLMKRKKEGTDGNGDDNKMGEKLVLAAKVWVLMRLLISSFGDAYSIQHEDEELREAVEAAKKSHASLRKRLRRGIERVLDRVDEHTNQADILQALCAYSLASSSGARDAVRHFLNVRGEAMALEFDYEEHERDKGATNVLNGLDLYTRTLLDVQALVPKKLSEALAGLKKKPLLADESLQALEGLRLDIYKVWCGDEMQYFTPFIRHDDFDGQQARDMLTDWAKKGGEKLLQGLGKSMDRMREFKAIVELRTSVLQQWIKDGGKAKGFDPSIMLDGLRNAINDRLLSVLDTKVSKLRLVGSEVAATLEAWHAGTSDRYHSLWDDEMLDMDLSNGSGQVSHEIISRLHGKNDAVSKAVTSYEFWYSLIDDVGEVVAQLRRQRWDNDVDEIEDEETIEMRQKMLSKDDPQKIDERLHVSLEQAYSHLDEQFGTLWQSYKDGTDSGQIAMYMLRVLRNIRERLPKLDGTKSFGLRYVPSLHQSLVAHVSSSPLDDFTTTALLRRRVTGRALWEGDPALPTGPSSGTFQLLRNLVTAMADAGLDLWSPAAVKMLKQDFGAQLCDTWRTTISSSFSTPPEPEAEAAKDKDITVDESVEGKTAETVQKATTATEDQRRDLLIQWVYDICLLQHYLGVGGDGPNDHLKDLADEVLRNTDLQAESKEKINKATQEYWRRTSLLFGLFA